MRIGIDVSQVVYEGTGVARYVKNIVTAVVKESKEHEIVLFGGAIRQADRLNDFIVEMHRLNPRVTGIILSLSPRFLDFLWNRLHVLPVERITGPLDVFWSSDWTQPPLIKAAGVTTIHDLSVLLFPESFDHSIVAVQRRRLKKAVKECSVFLCDSEATSKDAYKLLGIPKERLVTVYPGFSV
jgi:glycosyltransferase involved in cell wall biosynthesis